MTKTEYFVSGKDSNGEGFRFTVKANNGWHAMVLVEKYKLNSPARPKAISAIKVSNLAVKG